jgi:hypothetical protein
VVQVVDLGFPNRDAAALDLTHSDWPRVFVAWEDFLLPDCLALFLFSAPRDLHLCLCRVLWLWLPLSDESGFELPFQIEFVLLARVEGGIKRDVKLGADQCGLPVQC